MKNTSRIQSVIETILDNIFDIVTVGVALFLFVRYQIFPPTPDDLAEIFTWLLAVLGLLAGSGLWERNRKLRRIEKLSKEARDLTFRHLSKKVFASDFFSQGETLSTKDLSSANNIYFLGKVLARTSREYLHILGQRLVAGANIRFVVLDPEIETVLMQAELQSFDAPSSYYRETIRTTKTVIEALAKTPKSNGNVEIGYLPYVPSFGLVLIDPDESHGTCFVEIYQHRSAEPHPTFKLTAQDDPHWFTFFNSQYAKIWNSSRVKKYHKTPANPASS
jgi:hypothetical protein